MKVSQSSVRKVLIEEVDNLDPITVMLEDLKAGHGRIIIECFGRTFSHYWNGMGDGVKVVEFVCSCGYDYLIDKLGGVHSDTFDTDDIKKQAKRKIIEHRRSWHHDLDKHEARELFNRADSMDEWQHEFRLLSDVFGEDWRFIIESSPNPDYAYVRRIVETVQLALRENS